MRSMVEGGMIAAFRVCPLRLVSLATSPAKAGEEHAADRLCL